MNKQETLFDIPVNPADIVFTPRDISRLLIKHLHPDGICLDPCKGDGSFYDLMPEGSLYCEISEGKDFFDFNQKVDWIIGNPPYSIFETFLQKSFNLSDNVAFLIPTNKVFQRQIIMERINNYGGIRSIIIFGSGNLIGFPFGFSVGMFYFKKDYKGMTEIIMGMKQITSSSNK